MRRVIWSSFSILFIWSTTPLLFWVQFLAAHDVNEDEKAICRFFLSYGLFLQEETSSFICSSSFTSTRFSNVMDDKTWFVTNGLCAAIMTTAVTTTCTPFLDSPLKKWTASTFFGRWHQHDTHWSVYQNIFVKQLVLHRNCFLKVLPKSFIHSKFECMIDLFEIWI